MAFIPCFVPKVPPINISDPIWNSTVSNSLVLNRPGITGMRVLARPTQPKTGIFPQPAFIEKNNDGGSRDGRLLFVLRSRNYPEGGSMFRLWHASPRNDVAQSSAGWPPAIPAASPARVFP
jgi:hypothetical protein